MTLKKFHIFIFLTFVFNLVNAQNIDSLKQCLKTAKHDTSRLIVLEQLAELAPDGEWEKYNEELNFIASRNLKTDPGKHLEYIYIKYKAVYLNNIGTIYEAKGEIKKAINCIEESRKLLEKIGDEDGVANAYNNLGSIAHRQGKPEEALIFHNRSLATYRKTGNKTGGAAALTNIGWIYEKRGDIPKALDLYLEAIKMQESVNDKFGIARSYNNIGILYNKQGLRAKSIEYVLKSLKMDEELGNSASVSSAYLNLGFMYNEDGDTARARAYFMKGLKIDQESGNKDGIASCFLNLGYINYNKKNYDEALGYFEKSLNIRIEIGDIYGECNCLRNIGSVYFNKNEIKKAKEYALRSYKIALELNYPLNICDAASLLYKIYKKEGHGMEALEMYELYTTMRDTVSNEKTRKSSLKKQFQYEYDRKATTDSVKVADEKKVIALQLKQEQTTRYALYGGLALILIFSAFLYKRFKVEQRQKEVIANQKHLVEEKQKEIVDSINYAKKIQQSLLPTEKYIERNVNKLKDRK